MVATNRLKRILIVDDEPKIGEALSAYLQREGFEVTLAGTLERALEEYKRIEPDIMLLDITLTDGSGLDVLRVARSQGRQTPAIMLTARADEVDRIVGLELGADDYVTKPFSPREVVARVRAVLRRSENAEDVARTSSTIAIGDLEVDIDAHQVRIAGRDAGVTAKEFRVLRIFAENPGQTFTRTALLDALHDEGTMFERTLDRHINNLRKKIEIDPQTPHYLQTVLGVGYKMRPRDR
ncbi:MAG TPA: response regulator transcription factor [Verrucomicrobiae bacterium]|jgi:DNA-binding response OmpR family regulator|nr:response regulator transcription factor [Verrucomicrobiae bacterium]